VTAVSARIIAAASPTVCAVLSMCARPLLITDYREMVYVNDRHPCVKGGNSTNTAHRKRCEIRCKLVIFTDIKSHTVFRFVSKSVTLNDLERRNDGRRVRYLCVS